MIKKIQVYNNTSTDPMTYLTAMFQYYQKHGVTLNYDITKTNVLVPQSTLAYNPLVGNVYVIQGVEHLVPQTDHDITLFFFDLTNWKAPWYWPWPLWGNVPRDDTYMAYGKPFITIGYWPTDSTVQQRFLHEPMHALAKIFGCTDQMDTYDQDADYNSLTGNFAKQWAIFQPYLMPPQASTSPVQTPIDPKWGLVPALVTLAEKFFTECTAKGYALKITQGLRTNTEQAVLYAKGRTTPGPIVTNAEPGQSQHNFGKAFDVAFTGSVPYPTDDKVWKAIADIGVSIGLTAGYYFHSFQDKPHFEIK